MQDQSTIKSRHKNFIRTVCQNLVVYALECREGFATSSSVHYEYEDGEAVGIICFWAEEIRARSCIKKEWANYSVATIPLTEFIENWCVGMDNDQLLIGTEFDQNMYGFEAQPLELIPELISELRKSKIDLKFQKYEGIDDLENRIKSTLNH